jgi:glycosyltransferase involved in cell wall biosynthesis
MEWAAKLDLPKKRGTLLMAIFRRHTIHVIVPVFNAERHLFSFLQKLETSLSQVDFDWRVTLIIDKGSDDSSLVAQKFVSMKPKLQWNVFHATERLGQQSAISLGLSHVSPDEISLILDDDTLLEPNVINELVTPIVDEQLEMVIAQQKQHGFRKFTSGIFWSIHQIFSSGKVTGRDLMLRSMSYELSSRVSSAVMATLSISQAADNLSSRVKRISNLGVKFYPSRSRYSFFDRFSLFIELIVVSRKQVGYLIISIATMVYLFFLALMATLAMLGMINLNSSSSVLALVVATFGAVNLLSIGAIQISVSLILENLSSRLLSSK